MNPETTNFFISTRDQKIPFPIFQFVLIGLNPYVVICFQNPVPSVWVHLVVRAREPFSNFWIHEIVCPDGYIRVYCYEGLYKSARRPSRPPTMAILTLSNNRAIVSEKGKKVTTSNSNFFFRQENWWLLHIAHHEKNSRSVLMDVLSIIWDLIRHTYVLLFTNNRYLFDRSIRVEVHYYFVLTFPRILFQQHMSS